MDILKMSTCLKFLVSCLVLVGIIVSSEADEILGCGGYVKSPYKLDFDQIEIKLFTKQGSLKMQTECAPNTGYYFIPLDGKGDYVLKISPPEGWKFDPPEYAIRFDGKTDKCSKGVDINFEFKGFSIFGKVITSGFLEGPAGVTLKLSGPNNLLLDTSTSEGGTFAFGSIPPGAYKLSASHKSLTFEKEATSFEITNKNVVVENKLSVSGYEVSGIVSSDSNPVEGVILLLVSQDPKVIVPKSCPAVKKEDIHLPSGVMGKVICQQSSDKMGIYRFTGLKPGKYTVVPVYKGKNIVYNVSPDHLDFELVHESLKIKQGFEVEGFTVEGKVKGLPQGTQAKIFVNKALKATTAKDGSFTIDKMKPGNYKFEIKADKFQFDETSVSVTALNPVLPEFSPSRFLTCGNIQMSSSNPRPTITLLLQKLNQEKVIREEISDPINSCVYLQEGQYNAWLESSPEKYFLPSKTQIKVPSEAKFSFKEFTGSIGGTVNCPYSSCEGLKLIVENRNVGSIVQDKVLDHEETKFKFENLGSGEYRVRILDEKYCWKQDIFDNIQLKNANVESLKFVQTGYNLEIMSTHKTDVKISGKGKSSIQTVQLNADSPKRLCLSDVESNPASYKIEPVGCHKFEKAVYPFDVGSVVELVAIKHLFTGTLYSPAKITDLKLTKDDVAYNLHQLLKEDSEVRVSEKPVEGRFEYEISFMEEPAKEAEWQVFSYGFLFEPSSFTVQAKDDCQKDIFQVVAKKSHVIKGKLVPPLEGVEIRIDLVGDPDASTYVTSNAEGEYIAGPFVHPSGFKVVPEMSGYTFKEFSNDPYSFTVHQLAKIEVKVESGGEPLASVLLSLSGPNSYRQNKVTNQNGEMTFGDLQPGQYYLKALLKEFQFEPSATHIDLKEKETKQVTLKARRESFSIYGQLSSLGGDLVPNLLVSAKGVGNCSEYGEEGASDDTGNFRIWALKSYCGYQISVVKKDEFAQKVERTIPTFLDVKMGTEDMHNVSFLVIPPVRRLDLSLRCYTNNEKSLESLKAVVYSSRSPETPLHSSSFNGVSYIILPPIPKDDSEYFITFESNLNKFQYNYKLPPEINFTANVAYAHFKVYFDIEPASIDPEIGKNSYIAFAMVVLVILLIANFEKIGFWVKNIMENYSNNAANAPVSKKSKVKTK